MKVSRAKPNYFFQKTDLTIQKNKVFLRSFYKKQLETLSPSLKKQKESQIVKNLNKLPFWEDCSYIAVYQALGDEPCLSSFYKLWKDKLCYPVMREGRLAFYKSSGRWKTNSLSVREPVIKKENELSLQDISVFLCPGRAFDRSGGRLGRGKGYYDKTLSQLYKKPASKIHKLKPNSKKPKGLLIGLAFVEQIHNEQLPLLKQDVLLDMLVTDQFVLLPLEKSKTQKLRGKSKKAFNIKNRERKKERKKIERRKNRKEKRYE